MKITLSISAGTVTHLGCDYSVHLVVADHALTVQKLACLLHTQE